jgi:hypothetical protein
VILQHAGDGHGMLGVLLGYDGQVADLESVIACEILQGTFVVLGDLV